MTIMREPSPVELIRNRERDAVIGVGDSLPLGTTSLPEDRQTVPAAERLETFLCLTPVIGLLPSIWALYRHQRDNRQLAACRLSILMAIVWASVYLSLTLGADLTAASPTIAFRLLFVNSLATSGYFISSVWLMVLLWQNKSVRLPGFSALAERIGSDSSAPTDN
jgi:hypothetical protein